MDLLRSFIPYPRRWHYPILPKKTSYEVSAITPVPSGRLGQD
jgi:hypothetical protein